MKQHTTHFDGCECVMERLKKAEEQTKNYLLMIDELFWQQDQLNARIEKLRDALNDIAAWDFLSDASQWFSMEKARKALSADKDEK
jgi:hypothetical protein